jgi:hypothetical protein
MVRTETHHKAAQPLFPIVGLLLVERHVDQRAVLDRELLERQPVPAHVGKVLFRVVGVARPQPLEVLDLPPAAVVRLGFPRFVFGNRKERELLLGLGDLDDRGDELDKKVGQLEQRREPVVEEVDDETFDVRPVVVLSRADTNTLQPLAARRGQTESEKGRKAHLIGHDHQAPVPQRVRTRVHLPLLQPHNLLDRLNLCILQQRLAARLAHVEQFPAEREHAIIVAADDGESRDGERLGRVTFGEDEGALVPVAGAGVVGVFELDETGDAERDRLDRTKKGFLKVSIGCGTCRREDAPRALVTVRLLERLVLLELGPVDDVVDHARRRDCEPIRNAETRHVSFSLSRAPTRRGPRKCPKATTDSPFFRNCSERTHFDPNFFIVRVMFSLVCESKLGLSILQLTKRAMWFLIWNGLTVMFLCFFLTRSTKPCTIWSAT